MLEKEAEEMDRLEQVFHKGAKLAIAKERADQALSEFLQGEAKTRLGTQYKNFTEFETAVKDKLGTLYLSMKK